MTYNSLIRLPQKFQAAILNESIFILRRIYFSFFQKNEFKVKNLDRLVQYQYVLKLYQCRKGNVTFKDLLGISIRNLHRYNRIRVIIEYFIICSTCTNFVLFTFLLANIYKMQAIIFTLLILVYISLGKSYR